MQRVAAKTRRLIRKSFQIMNSTDILFVHSHLASLPSIQWTVAWRELELDMWLVLKLLGDGRQDLHAWIALLIEPEN